MDKKLIDIFKYVIDSEEKQLSDLSNIIDEIIENNIQSERTISEVFDAILSLAFTGDDQKRKVFHKLSNYCRKFNKELADDYDEILEDDLSYIEEDMVIEKERKGHNL